MNVREYYCMLQDVVHMEVTDPWIRERVDTKTQRKEGVCTFLQP